MEPQKLDLLRDIRCLITHHFFVVMGENCLETLSPQVSGTCQRPNTREESNMQFMLESPVESDTAEHLIQSFMPRSMPSKRYLEQEKAMTKTVFQTFHSVTSNPPGN
jgi:hypothetical protein